MYNFADLTEKLRCTALFSWMPPEGVEMFQNCFDLETAHLRAGEHRSCAGQLGLVLSGALESEGRLLGPGALFGAAWDGTGRLRPTEVSVSAQQDSETVFLDGAVLTSVCYRACWFHGRFVLEAGKYL